MKRVIRKWMSLITVFALVIMMITPTMSIATTEPDINETWGSSNIVLTVTTPNPTTYVGENITFNYTVKNNDWFNKYDDVKMLQGDQPNLPDVSKNSTISGSYTYVVKASDWIGSKYQFTFQTQGKLGFDWNKKSNTVVLKLDQATGTLTVNKSYSDQSSTAEVGIQLLVDNGSGFVPMGSPQMTSGLTTQFTGLDLSKSYMIEESPVPEEFSVSYPGGQAVVFSGTSAVLSVVNTPLPPVFGSITVNKVYIMKPAPVGDKSIKADMVIPEVMLQLQVSDDNTNFADLGAPVSTVGLVKTFSDLAINKYYRVVESPVPAGYFASYSDNVYLSRKSLSGEITVTNSMDIMPPVFGTLIVNKVYDYLQTPPPVETSISKTIMLPEVMLQLQISSNGIDFSNLGEPVSTISLMKIFNGLSIDKYYRVIETPVPSGFNVSYSEPVYLTKQNVEDSITVTNTEIEPVKYGILNVTKSYSNGATGEVEIQLQVNGETGYVPLITKTTSGLKVQFEELDLDRSYRIVEINVPFRYSESYPNGQLVVFGEGVANLTVLNTRLQNPEPEPTPPTPTPPEPTPIPAEPVPLAAPVINEPVPFDPPPADEVVVEEVIPLSAPDELVPLAAPVLPKTGELPGFLFYGLGTMITGIGVMLRRKSQ